MDKLAMQIKKTWVLGLMVDCPLGKDVNDCPAKEIRELSLEDRVELVKEMDENNLKEIIMHHKRCVKEPEIL